MCGLKVHEDTGATVRTIDTALRVAEEFDIQVALHTDGLNETMSVEDTLAVLDGRVLHAYHVEGCGGGHAPNVLELAGHDNVLASSTNPTLPFGVNAVAEHLDMILLSHGMNPGNDSDVRIARSRVRDVTMAAEGRLHDLGIIGVTSSDAQGMGRAGETWWRTFALAGVLAGRERDATDAQADASDGDDNERILRYLAKITINPALVHGLAHEVGRLAVGHLADIVLWRPEYFAAKPQLVIKGGFPAWGVTGDPNASIDSAEPLVLGPQYGAHGVVPGDLAVLFSNEAAIAESAPRVSRRVVPVRDCRTVRASALVRHGGLGHVEVSDDGSRVTLDGERVSMDPVDTVPISRLHYW